MTPEEIESRRRALLEQLEALDAMQRQSFPAPRSTASASAARSKSGRSLRDLTLDALEEIGFVTYTQQLMLYVKARFGRDITPTRFGTLSVDEQRAFARASSRSTWLCHGLTHDRAEPVKRLWGRSDWPLQQRIVSPAFGRAQYLRAAARFAELAMKEEGFAEPDLMRFIAADHARDLGIVVRHGQFDLEEWKAAAEEQLAEVAEKESVFAVRAANEWSRTLTPSEQLFGRKSKPVLVGVPKSKKQA